jgi:hypothetical protein
MPVLPITDSLLTVSKAAERTGVPKRTIRAWCSEWPGLGLRVGRDWQIDPDLLREMVACRGNAGRLTIPPPQHDASGPPRLPAGPPPRQRTLTVAEAAAFLGVERPTITRLCASAPGFGRQRKDRGEWRVDLGAATLLGALRVAARKQRRRYSLAVLAKQAVDQSHRLQQGQGDPKLQAKLRDIRHGKDAAPLIERIRAKLQRTKDRKRTPPAAAVQPGEVRDGQR